MKRIVKKVIPASGIKLLKKARVSMKANLVAISSRSGFLSSIYYLFNSGFRREHQSVLQGRKVYEESLKKTGSSALLRRNIHRIEKGLIMKPRRDVFAESYIKETVNCYAKVVKSNGVSPDCEKKWATNVLEEYFSVVADTNIISSAKNSYEMARGQAELDLAINGDFPTTSGNFKPYTHDQLPNHSIDFEEIRKLFIRRRSVRWFQDKPVSSELVRKAASIASMAPSACNRLSYRFLFCNQKEKVEKIASSSFGTTGYTENIPAIITIVGDLSAYPYERDRHIIYIDASLAAMQLMLALQTLGLATCSINWPDVEMHEKRIRRVIELENHERVIMLMAVGYAADKGGIPYSQKKKSDLIFKDISQ